MRRIGSDADIREGLEALTGACPHLARVHALTGNPPLRKRPKGFEGLSRVIVGQQLSIASADAIWGRVRARVEPFEAATLLKIPDKDLTQGRAVAGQDRNAARGRRGNRGGKLKLNALARAPEDAIHAELTSIKGIGPWTADIYIMFSLARADAWSPGDLALQYAVKDALLLAERPSLAEMTELAEVLAAVARRRRAAALVLITRFAASATCRVPTRFHKGARLLRGPHGNWRSPLAKSEPDMP